MRAKNWILGCAATTAVIMACVGAGCGGDDSTATPGPDAGADVTADHTAPMPDASPDTAPLDSAPMCMSDADITMIHIDAGADGGACISCVQTHCQMAISDCNMDCDCKSAFVAFLACTSGGGALTTCAFSTLANIDQTIQGEFFSCAPACASTCGVSLDGGDGGRDGASDAPSDAPADGG